MILDPESRIQRLKKHWIPGNMGLDPDSGVKKKRTGILDPDPQNCLFDYFCSLCSGLEVLVPEQKYGFWIPYLGSRGQK
jgi:hypothetical protein